MSPPTRLLPLVALVRSNTLRCLALIALSALPASRARIMSIPAMRHFCRPSLACVLALPVSWCQAHGHGLGSSAVSCWRCFFLRLRDVAIYVSLFALGHSLTLILGVMFELNATLFGGCRHGLSVVYKALENLAQQRGRRLSLILVPRFSFSASVMGWVWPPSCGKSPCLRMGC